MSSVLRCMATRGWTLGLLATVCMIAPACKGKSKNEGKNKQPAVSKAKKPAIANVAVRMQGEVAKKMREVDSTPALIAEGKKLFGQCAACHGDNGEGRIGVGPRLVSKSFLAAASDSMLIRTISHGRAGTTMIPWRAALTQNQIRAIIAYVRSLAPAKALALNEKPLKGDLKSGGKLYFSICSACHGRAGAGYQETANGTGIGRRAFLDSVSNGFLRYLIRNGKDQTKMRPFASGSKVAVANLNDQQIDDVIVYLRTKAW